ncbi:MAG: hypothetical protein FJW26_21395 [Acidimicrobiia bacterium]|nr:hypothetical protein [Acidimicrobiia bacterium]
MMKPSKLAPYQTLIAAWRQEGKSYREIVQILRDSHGLNVGRNTLHSFVKVRSKRPRAVYTMLKNTIELRASGDSLKHESHPTPADLQPLKTGGNDHGGPRPKRFNYTYSNTYNLTRLTPEQKAALEKKLEDQQKGEP